MTRPSTRAVLPRNAVIPVITVDRVDQAVPLADALIAGGLGAIEVTLRTDAGLPALAAMAAAHPTVPIGAGTVVTADQMAAAVDAGAAFLVSPGLTDPLAEAGRAMAVPFLPGVATATEVMRARDHGFTEVKFFPAEIAGGARALTGLAAVFPDLGFCPTGGITADNAPAYLALDAVFAVGGSWMAPKAAVERGDWQAIRDLAAAAARIGEITA